MPKMPIDVKQILEAAVGFGQERDAALRVDVVFDATASDALIASLYPVLCEEVQTGNAEVEQYVLSGGLPALRPDADLCVVVGGQSRKLGNVMGSARNNGTPAVCVIERDATFFEEAGVQGAPQAAGAQVDAAAGAGGESGAGAGAGAGAGEAGLGADVPSGAGVAPLAARAGAGTGAGANAGVGAGAAAPAGVNETEYVAAIDVDDIVDVDLSEERPLDPLATWVASRLPKKQLALGAAFPFMRHALARELTQSNAIANGAIGVVAFMPGSDMPLITANQVKLVLQMATIYGKELDRARVKEAVAVVLGAFGWRAIARRLTRFVPVLGVPVKTAVAYTGTLAVGHAACAYFENDGEEKCEEVAAAVVQKGKELLAHADAA